MNEHQPTQVFHPLLFARPVPRQRTPCACGSVVFSDGRPAANMLLRFAHLSGKDATALTYTGARTDREGRFIGPDFPAGVTKARFAVSVCRATLAPYTSQGFLAAPQVISVSQGKTAEMQFVLQPPAYVRGRICTRQGRPVFGVWVQVPDVSFDSGPTTYHSVTRTTSDRNGEFVLPVPVGSVSLELERTAATVYHAQRFSIRLEPGQVAQVSVPVSLRVPSDMLPAIDSATSPRYTAMR